MPGSGDLKSCPCACARSQIYSTVEVKYKWKAKRKSSAGKSDVPSSFVDKGRDAEDEEHKKHGSMLEVIEVRGVECPIHHPLHMRGIEKLNVHVRECADEKTIKLYVLPRAFETADWVPDPPTETLGVGHIDRYRIYKVPDAY